MARIVAVYGIGNQYGENISCAAVGFLLCKMAWPALGQTHIIEADLSCAFFGDLFWPSGNALVPFYDASDLDDEWVQKSLLAWWNDAAQLDPLVSGPDTVGKGIGWSVLQIDLRSIATAGSAGDRVARPVSRSEYA
jgi:hypothetical protein